MDSIDTQATVVVDQVSRKFDVAVSRSHGRGVRGKAQRWLRGGHTVTVHALRSVSFVAHAGETIGIVGTNGSGKSTLLRLIAGLDQPSRGQVLARSQPMLLGVSAALQPDLSGVENARMGLLALGFTPDRVASTLPKVFDIAGIGDAVHRPMRTYSSGMGARLRFAIAAAAEPDILLLDEVLSTGDAASAQRAEARMTEMRARAGTVFLVSHAAQTIEELCTRALWIHEGILIQDGDASATARAYRWWAWNVAKGEHETATRLLQETTTARLGVDASTSEAAATTTDIGRLTQS
ncbi:ABC transporter ATP-binding protein [uncultured Serinicoccus sp.]|uniref:ABC transporter ATP-binding protein n=1 Tax=uncultured Serinicoccus sp. TaxID=735514 RepID=UPI0026094B7D|nr:ABC transporter ATP-binding protein [uncultured Serinicoccus sp.]